MTIIRIFHATRQSIDQMLPELMERTGLGLHGTLSDTVSKEININCSNSYLGHYGDIYSRIVKTIIS